MFRIRFNPSFTWCKKSNCVNDIEELPICVTEKERAGFIEKYRTLFLREFSAQIFVFYARKE